MGRTARGESPSKKTRLVCPSETPQTRLFLTPKRPSCRFCCSVAVHTEVAPLVAVFRGLRLWSDQAKVNSRFLTGRWALFGMTRVSLGWLYAALKRRYFTVVRAAVVIPSTSM